MSKRIRQQVILDLVSKERIPSQAALAAALKVQGFDVTQATLSRDIAELSLVKSKDGYKRPEDASGSAASLIPDPSGTLKRLVSKVIEADNLVVIRTPPGSAKQIAIVLEDGSFEQVVGTLGGDDTCLVVCKSKAEAVEFRKELLDFVSS